MEVLTLLKKSTSFQRLNYFKSKRISAIRRNYITQMDEFPMELHKFLPDDWRLTQPGIAL